MSEPDNTKADEPAPAPAAKAAVPSLKARRLRWLAIAAGAFAVLGAGYGAWWAKNLRYLQATDDAYVSGNVVQITPQISGTVVAIGADDTQFVKAGQTLVKLALDSIVQREISPDVRSSTFAASETLHQLSWVIGALLGLLLSITGSGVAGLSVAAAGLALSLVALVAARRRRNLRLRLRPHPGQFVPSAQQPGSDSASRAQGGRPI